MRDPFRIEGPAILNVSGGRTSMYMLRRMLSAHGGKLPADVVPTFQNTGKEDPLTLDFIHECETRWGVTIAWLEWQPAVETKDRWKRVSYETAARNGEPFEALIGFAQQQGWKVVIPTPVNRICTFNLKAKTVEQFALNALGWVEWLNAVGLRYDEPGRVARMIARTTDKWTNTCPLHDGRVTRFDVIEFWRDSEFDLALPLGSDASTPLGNCDCCFLKSPNKLRSIVNAHPDRAVWWAKMESKAGAPFRNDRADYATMIARAKAQFPLGLEDEIAADDAIDCACTD